MILVDTSVWIDHLHRSEPLLVNALEREDVLAHPFVIGEIACGALKHRDEVLNLLSALPRAVVATHDEVLNLIEERRLMGKGLAYVDVHLIASTILTPLAQLWTRDKSLRAALDTSFTNLRAMDAWSVLPDIVERDRRKAAFYGSKLWLEEMQDEAFSMIEDCTNVLLVAPVGWRLRGYVARLVARSKPAVVYVAPTKTFYTLKTPDDLATLLSSADADVRSRAEEYIHDHVAEFARPQMFWRCSHG